MPNSKREEVVITDLVDRVVEKNLLSAITRRDKWRIVDYELEKLGSGRALGIGKWQPGPLTIKLELKGYYRISFITRYTTVRAKLTDELCFGQCEPVIQAHKLLEDGDIYRTGYYDAEEVFWREADLTGQDLILDDQTDGLEVLLMAIRLSPCQPKAEDGEVRWPMVITDDGGTMGKRIHRSPNDMFEREELVPKDGCLRVLIYSGIEGDNCHHFTEVGSEYGSLTKEQGEPWYEPYANIAENLQKYRDWGINPATAIVEHAHKRGWELHFYVRMRGWNAAVQCIGPGSSRFYVDHPEYRMFGPNGEPVLGLSLAYREVQEHMAKLFAELASFGADGVSPCFIRGCPVVFYEPVMVEGFEKEYGLDPRKLDESDTRWLDYTAKVVTEFMRQAKEAIGPDCKLSPMIHGTSKLNRRFGLDIATWVKEGLVSDLFIMGNQYDRHGGHFPGGVEHIDLDFFQGLAGRQNVRLWPMLYPWGEWWFDKDRQGQCTALQQLLDKGADGYGFWDMAARDSDRGANSWDLGKMPRVQYSQPERVLGKFEIVRWDGYMWNKYTGIDGW